MNLCFVGSPKIITLVRDPASLCCARSRGAARMARDLSVETDHSQIVWMAVIGCALGPHTSRASFH